MEEIQKDRAWIELNMDNLEHNINQIKKVIPKECEIMAVVKANAYGHGIVQISKKLNEIGIDNFAVATLSEGIILRENNIKWNILILGYTDIDDIKYVQKYDLIQTIIDYDYAEKINNVKLENKLKVHVKINTGMNRIGESYTNIGKLIKIYQMDNLEILGTFTHLCSSDSLDESDIEFTKKQIENFYKCTENIKSLGYDIGKIHIQASYGILNYPELNCDYVRPGIIMYGAFSSKNDKTKINIDLKPALSLKARVTSVKQIDAGQTVSYGRTFKANKTMKIATVSIGYADGYPRNLSNKQAKVLVNNEYATIIGRICMDQLVIDVTNIANVKQGDIVTLIGDEPEISVENIAELSGTITNEILCRIGARIERFWHLVPVLFCHVSFGTGSLLTQI